MTRPGASRRRLTSQTSRSIKLKADEQMRKQGLPCMGMSLVVYRAHFLCGADFLGVYAVVRWFPSDEGDGFLHSQKVEGEMA